MDNIREKIEQLTLRINELAQQQSSISRQLLQLINELDSLKQQAGLSASIKENIPVPAKVVETKQNIAAPGYKAVTSNEQASSRPAYKPTKRATGFEEFIGKNLASKVGILVTIIGIFIGAKYAIEHNMVKPIVRIVSGYTSGLVLIGIAAWLKKKYEGYSSVLMGGGIAVLYFITYIAYSFYGLLPQATAFILMLLFTIGTVYAAFMYNRSIIAHLGLVGAYAIPFLLSDNSGRYLILFAYISIINAGILVIAFRKYWKSLFYTAYIITWLIYAVWYIETDIGDKYFGIASLFLGLFFIIFYATFLGYKLVKKEQYNISDVFIMLSNAFIFYGFGYHLMMEHPGYSNYLGLFTVINAVIHLAVSQLVRKLGLADKSLYYLVFGLVIVFLTIAIPVQFDGNWVTLLWTAEAVLVFIIGRTRSAKSYERLGIGLIALSVLSLLHDWFNHLDEFIGTGHHAQPFLNIAFITGLIVASSQAVIIYFNRNKKYIKTATTGGMISMFYDYGVPALFLIITYLIFEIELQGYFHQVAERVQGRDLQIADWNIELYSVDIVSIVLYSMVFVGVVLAANSEWIKNKGLSEIFLLLTALIMFVLMVEGLSLLHKLSVFYTNNQNTSFGYLDIVYRYIIMLAAIGLLLIGRNNLQKFLGTDYNKKAWSLLMHAVVLSFLSAEFLHWTISADTNKQYKLGLSILWGLYALFLIVLGIRKKGKYLRLAAIVLFIITLIKLFFYDLAEAGTITRTITFVSIGTILLLVSYLYNRYKETLFGEEPKH